MSLKSWWQSNPVRWLVVLLFVFSYLYRLGGINPLSRLMTLCAMSEYHTFRVDSYVQPAGALMRWGDDWARTPDGHYYSNKAPGPMLVAFPAFWIYDRLATSGLGTPAERDAFRWRNRRSYLFFLAMLLQVVPWALLTLWLGWVLSARRGLPPEAVSVFAAATLFGNPSSFFVSSFFGHGFVSWLSLGLGVSVWLKKPILGGLLFGFALLSDYGTLFILPALLLGVVLFLPEPLRFLSRFVVGALAPAVLWFFYHMVCFGSAFVLPNAFQNAVYRDMEGQRFNIWGVFVPIPDPGVTLQLMFGTRRGVLLKSPWVGVALAWLFVHRAELKRGSPEIKALAVLSVGGFLGLFYMNTCFGGWEGGAAPVARYLSASFPLLALLTTLLYWKWAPNWKRALHVGIAASCAYFLYYNVFRLPYLLQERLPPPLSSVGLAPAVEWTVAAGLLALATFQTRLPGAITPRVMRWAHVRRASTRR